MKYADIDMATAHITANRVPLVETTINVREQWWHIVKSLLIARLKGRNRITLVIWGPTDDLTLRVSSPQGASRNE